MNPAHPLSTGQFRMQGMYFISFTQSKTARMRKSAGILLYRKMANKFEFFLVHPGGPFWKDKDAAHGLFLKVSLVIMKIL